jgi:hypothetical protein
MSQTIVFDGATRDGVRLPSLDWPRDLFADNVTEADLIAEDFPLAHEIAFMASQSHSPRTASR